MSADKQLRSLEVDELLWAYEMTHQKTLEQEIIRRLLLYRQQRDDIAENNVKLFNTLVRISEGTPLKGEVDDYTKVAEAVEALPRLTPWYLAVGQAMFAVAWTTGLVLGLAFSGLRWVSIPLLAGGVFTAMLYFHKGWRLLHAHDSSSPLGSATPNC